MNTNVRYNLIDGIEVLEQTSFLIVLATLVLVL